MSCNCAKKSSEKWLKLLYERNLKAKLEKEKIEKEKEDNGKNS